MPTPMSHAQAKKLCGGSSLMSPGQMLREFFAVSPKGKTKLSFADQERGWLQDEGCAAGLSRTDMWKKIVSSIGVERPYTNKMTNLAAIPRSAYAFKESDKGEPVGIVINIGSTYVKA